MIVNTMIESSQDLIYQIHSHPFNQELQKGTLPLDTFIFYLQQDALYLAEYARALALTAARLPNTAHLQQFTLFALNAINAECELHYKVLNKYQADNKKMEQSPACFMYVNYLLKTASLASIEEAVASLLPCFYIYNEVGKKMKAHQSHNNPYQDWIDLYSGAEFEASVLTAIAITNELGMNSTIQQKERMNQAFRRATQLEWLFWQSAYSQETWPMQGALYAV